MDIKEKEKEKKIKQRKSYQARRMTVLAMVDPAFAFAIVTYLFLSSPS